ncbi:hypothetical protein JCM1840_004624 [Sporobolomyces johnsonii]
MEHRAISPLLPPVGTPPDEPPTTSTTSTTTTTASTSDPHSRPASPLDDVDLDSPRDTPPTPPTSSSIGTPSSESTAATTATPPPGPSTTTAVTFPPPSQQLPVPSTSTLLTTPSAPLPASAPPVARTLSSSSASATHASIYGVCLVGFDHAIGPNIEFAYPPELERNDELNRNLPFLALPDGAHAREEDYSYFHLLVPSIHPRQTVFGISCNRQIPADELLNKGKDVTRSTVQKAIVVLASKPIFGALRDKLGVITRSFFAQRDFADKSILVDLYSSFELSKQARRAARAGEREGANGKGKGRAEEESLGREGEEPGEEDPGMYMGTSLREFVYKFRFKTLMLLKLLMLQRRVMFFATSTPVELLCTFQYSLVALIPALLTNLEDAASPELDERSRRVAKPSSLRTSERGSLVRYLGLPLDVFGKGSFFQPYLPLQQIDLLKTKSFLVGTTNSIFQQQRDCNIDVIVNIDNATLDILNPALTPLITLTAADRKWMDELVTTVDQSWDPRDPGRPQGQGFVGSEDFLRGKFEEYVCSLLACVKFGDFLANGARADMLLSAPELESYNPASFNEAFLKAFRRTKAFELWDRTTDEVIFDLVEPKHPMEGKTNPLEDVGIRLVHGLHDLHLQENLAPTREAITRGLSSGGESIWGAYRWAREEANRRAKEGSEEGGRAWVQGGLEGASKGAQSVVAGIAGGFLGAARKSGLFAPTTRPAANEATAAAAAAEAPRARARAPSPTPSVSSATSNKSCSQLVTPTTSPSIPQGSFLRPLSTAVAAAPATPSSSSSLTSSAPPAPTTSGLGGFFGGLRRSFIEGSPAPASSSSSSLPIPIAIPGLSWRGSTSSSASPAPSSPSSSSSSSFFPPAPPPTTTTRTRQLTLERELRSTTGDEAITVRDLDEEAVAAARDLDKEWDERERCEREERDRERGRDEARRKLEGGA